MYLIKRYANRKLYDIQRNRYINLDEIAGLIRSGLEISVIDNASGEDITNVTLTQIIVDREKRQGNFLPRSLLSTLIQAGGGSLMAIRQKIFPQLALLNHIDEEIRLRFQKLLQRGEITEEMAKKLLAGLLDDNIFRVDFSTITPSDLEDTLQQLDIPGRGEFQQLINQVDQLSAKLDKLRK